MNVCRMSSHTIPGETMWTTPDPLDGVAVGRYNSQAGQKAGDMSRNSYLTAADLAQVAQTFPSPRVRKITEEVSIATGIPVRHILSDMRVKNVCLARDLVYYIAARNGISTVDIGKAMKRDHTSVMAGIGRERARRGE